MDMMEEIKLIDAAELLQVPPDTLIKRIKRGKLSAVKRDEGKKPVWYLSRTTFNELLAELPANDYPGLVQEWKNRIANGLHSGRPVSAATLKAYQMGLDNLWAKSGVCPGLSTFTLDTYEKAMIAIGPDQKRSSQKLKIYDAYCSFLNFLIEKGLRSYEELGIIHKKRPAKNKNPHRPYLERDQLQVLLDFNRSRCAGRDQWDIEINDLAFRLAAEGGLRSSEICRIQLQDIYFDRQELLVHGKGEKDRWIGLSPALMTQMAKWISVYRPESATNYLLVKRDGEPLDRHYLLKRLKRMTNNLDFDTNVHGLRRTFTSLAIEDEVSVVYLQENLGHSDIRVTREAYIHVQKRKALEWMKRNTSSAESMPTLQPSTAIASSLPTSDTFYD